MPTGDGLPVIRNPLLAAPRGGLIRTRHDALAPTSSAQRTKRRYSPADSTEGSTSAVPYYELARLRDIGARLPTMSVVDEQGRPADDPETFYRGGDLPGERRAQTVAETVVRANAATPAALRDVGVDLA
jgi:hypothetical protein